MLRLVEELQVTHGDRWDVHLENVINGVYQNVAELMRDLSILEIEQYLTLCTNLLEG